MPVKARNRVAPWWYTPTSQKDDPNPTKFKVRGLTGTEEGYVQPELIVDHAAKSVTGMTGKGLEMTLRYGLLDWENFSDAEGKPIAFSPRNFELIDFELQSELAMIILTASYVSKEEKKT